MELQKLFCCLCALVLFLAGCGEKAPAALQPGTVYTADHCLYMSPHNSAIWFDSGDPGVRIVLEDDAFSWTVQGTEEKRTAENVTWGWQKFPYTDEEWYALFDEKRAGLLRCTPQADQQTI